VNCKSWQREAELRKQIDNDWEEGVQRNIWRPETRKTLQAVERINNGESRDL
jgi:hypothetical protein